MDDLGPLMRLESVPFHYSRGAMKSAIPQNRSGFFSVIGVIVAGPWPPAGLIQPRGTK